MIEDIKKLIETYNDVSEGVLIKIEVEDYVKKIAENAVVLNYYKNSNLIGFIAYYANDSSKKNAFLTMLMIDKSSRGLGLGKLLLNSSISDLSNQGFLNYKLEVLKKNTKAIKLYLSYGFIIEEDRGDLWLMSKNLQENIDAKYKTR
jgi:ribosomal protein S18 acetylase RimI-like enzyme